jgi:hypothetical protein
LTYRLLVWKTPGCRVAFLPGLRTAYVRQPATSTAMVSTVDNAPNQSSGQMFFFNKTATCGGSTFYRSLPVMFARLFTVGIAQN